MRNDILERKDYILDLINNNTPKAEICRILKCKTVTLDSYLVKMDIKYDGNKGRKGSKHHEQRKPAMFYIENNKIIGSHRLKNKLIEDGIKEHKCEKCKLTEWLGEKIPLELHHIDGNKFNNDLINLQLLCPNCHSKSENNSGKGIKIFKNNNQKKSNRLKKLCNCGKEIRLSSKTCKECYNKQRKIDKLDEKLCIKIVL